MKTARTIFLTGATGFIGAHLVHELVRKGCSFFLLVRPGRMTPEQRIESSLRPLCRDEDEWRLLRKSIEIIPGDLSADGMSEAFRRAEDLKGRIDDVIHNAALTKFDRSWDDLSTVNIHGTERMLEFTINLENPRFHYVSTAYVCGDYDGDFREDSLEMGQSFNNLYEKSKYEAERLVARYADRFGLRTSIYRPSIVVGDSVSGRTSNFLGVYSFVKAIHLIRDLFCCDIARGGERARTANAFMDGETLEIPFRIPARPGKTLNIVPVDYVVSVIARSVLTEESKSLTYHITNPSPPTLEELCSMLCDFFNVRGLRIISADELNERPLNAWENFFLASMRDVSAYLTNSEPRFSDLNTRRLLQHSGISFPHVTREMISVLAGYYLQSRKLVE
jgi:nucleoside-diphosphate-sugar epimerase